MHKGGRPIKLNIVSSKQSSRGFDSISHRRDVPPDFQGISADIPSIPINYKEYMLYKDVSPLILKRSFRKFLLLFL